MPQTQLATLRQILPPLDALTKKVARSEVRAKRLPLRQFFRDDRPDPGRQAVDTVGTFDVP